MVRLCSTRPGDYSRMLGRIGVGWEQGKIGLMVEGRANGKKEWKRGKSA